MSAPTISRMAKLFASAFTALLLLAMSPVQAADYAKNLTASYDHSSLTTNPVANLILHEVINDQIVACEHTEVRAATLMGTFHFGEEFNLYVDAHPDYALNHVVNLNIVGYETFDGSGIPLFTHTIPNIQITELKPESRFQMNLTPYLGNLARVEVAITYQSNDGSLISTAADASVALDLEVVEEKAVNVQTGSSIFASANATSLVSNSFVTLNWNIDANYCGEPTAYEVQIQRLFHTADYIPTGTDISTDVSWDGALTVTTPTNATSYRINLFQGTGWYVYRVRPIGNFYEPTQDIRNFGAWHTDVVDDPVVENDLQGSDFAFYFTQASDDVNAVLGRDFKGPGEIVEQIDYLDGMLVPRQRQVKNSVDPNCTQLRQYVPDYAGRPLLESMTLPAQKLSFGYEDGLLLNENNEVYSAADYDQGSKVQDPSTANGPLAEYFDGDDDPQRASAGGYPFKRAIVSADPGGRVKEISGVGAYHNVAGDSNGKKHTERYDYGVATDEELVALMGAEAPTGSRIRRTIQRTADDLLQIAYVDEENRIIATALGATIAPTSFDQLPSRQNSEQIKTLNVTGGEPMLLKRKEWPFFSPTDVHLEYSLTAADFGLSCEHGPDPGDLGTGGGYYPPDFEFCATCDYEVRLAVTNLDDGTVYYERVEHLDPVDCDNPPTLTEDTWLYGLPVGNYEFLRTIKLLNGDPLTGSSYRDSMIADAGNQLEVSLLSQLQPLYDLLDQDDPEAFYNYLLPFTAQDGTITYPLSCCTIDVPVLDCEIEACNDPNPQFEQLLLDAYPTLGSHLNDFFFTKGNATYVPGVLVSFEAPTTSSGAVQMTELYVSHGLDGKRQDDLFVFPVALGSTKSATAQNVANYVHFRFQAGEIPYDAVANGDFVEIYANLGANAVKNDPLVMQLGFQPDQIAGFFVDDPQALYPNGDGAFDEMIAHMIAEGNYTCEELYQCWMGVVSSYEAIFNVQTLPFTNDGVNYTWQTVRTYDQDILDMFLNCLGVHYEGYSDCPYGNCGNGTLGFLEYAHRYFRYEGGRPDCEGELPATPTATDWLQFKYCINSEKEPLADLEIPAECQFADPENPTQAETDACLEALRIKSEESCSSACWDRYDSFVEQLYNLYVAEGYTVQPDDDASGNYQILFSDLECTAVLLVEHCQGNCVLSPGVTDFDLDGIDDIGEYIGDIGEIQAMAEAITYTYELALPDLNDNCPAGFDKVAGQANTLGSVAQAMENELYSFYQNLGPAGGCWDYETLLESLLPAGTAITCQGSNVAGCDGIYILPDIPYTFDFTSGGLPDNLIAGVISQLNVLLQGGGGSLTLPQGAFVETNGNCINGANLTVNVAINSGELIVSMTFPPPVPGGESYSCIWLGGTLQSGAFFLTDGQGNVQLDNGGSLQGVGCLKFCSRDGCSITFIQELEDPCDFCTDKGEELMSKLNALYPDDGIITPSEWPLGLRIYDDQGICIPPLTLPSFQLAIRYIDISGGRVPTCTAIPQQDGGLAYLIEVPYNGTFELANDGEGIMYVYPGGTYFVDCFKLCCQFGREASLTDVATTTSVGATENPCLSETPNSIVIGSFTCNWPCVTESCLPVCFKWVEPSWDPQVTLEDITCENYVTSQVKDAIVVQVNACIANQQAAIAASYDAECGIPDDVFTATFSEGIYHHTLYYHDRAGNMVRTVPPSGVSKTGPNGVVDDRTQRNSHEFVSEYIYDSYDNVIHRTTPDDGSIRNFYDHSGRLRFTVKESQVPERRYLYFIYNELGRQVICGEAELPAGENYDYLTTAALQAIFPEIGPSTNFDRRERKFTKYTTAFPFPDLLPKRQRFIRNNVSYTLVDADEDLTTTDDQSYMVYSYNPHGHVEWNMQVTAGLGCFLTEYEYDVITGVVEAIHYQEGKPDEFHHRYSFDEAGRPLSVETSRDGVIYDRDARYTYNANHSPKRMVLGEDQVQGLDLTYTVQGWFKALNHPNLQAQLDPGMDGQANTVGRDAMGLVLGYFDGDFYADGSAFNANGSAGAYRQNMIRQGDSRVLDLYNGNVASVVTGVQDHGQASNFAELHAWQYRYDEMNRLTQARFSHFNQNWVDVPDYATNYAYDPNGNFTSIQRNGVTGQGLAMDDLSFQYYGGTNRLRRVQDQVSNSPYANDLETQPANNYTYDADGNMEQDLGSNVTSIAWTASGRIAHYEIFDQQNNGTRTVSFTYNADDQRIAKHETVSWSDDEVHHYYVYDARGRTMAVYQRADVLVSNGGTTELQATYTLLEQSIYSGERMGQRVANTQLHVAQVPVGDIPTITYDDPQVQHQAAGQHIVVAYAHQGPTIGIGGNNGGGNGNGNFGNGNNGNGNGNNGTGNGNNGNGNGGNNLSLNQSLDGDYAQALNNVIFPYEVPYASLSTWLSGTDFDEHDVHVRDIEVGGNATPADEIVEFSGIAPSNISKYENGCGQLLLTALTARQYEGLANVTRIFNAEGDELANGIGLFSDWRTQSVFVGHPVHDHIVYLFTTGFDRKPYYHVIDLHAVGNGTAGDPAGEVISKNNGLDLGNWRYGFGIAALEDTREGYSSTVYLRRRGTNNQYQVVSVEISENGVGSPVVMAFGLTNDTYGRGRMQVSPEADRLLLTNNYSNDESLRILNLSDNHQMVTSSATYNLPQNQGRTVLSADFDETGQYAYFVRRRNNNNKTRVYLLDLSDINNTPSLVKNLNQNRPDIVLGGNGRMYLAQASSNRLRSVLDGTALETTLMHNLTHQVKLTRGFSTRTHKIGTVDFCPTPEVYEREVAQKVYEMQDHRGTVRVVVSDLKQVDIVNDAPANYRAIANSSAGYYPFGMQMPGMDVNASDYRYGFQGMEKDKEVAPDGNNYTTLYRAYDPRIGRWTSVDSKAAEFAAWSPYVAFHNNPVNLIDPDGDASVEQQVAADFIADLEKKGIRYATEVEIEVDVPGLREPVAGRVDLVYVDKKGRMHLVEFKGADPTALNGNQPLYKPVLDKGGTFRITGGVAQTLKAKWLGVTLHKTYQSKPYLLVWKGNIRQYAAAARSIYQRKPDGKMIAHDPLHKKSTDVTHLAGTGATPKAKTPKAPKVKGFKTGGKGGPIVNAGVAITVGTVIYMQSGDAAAATIGAIQAVNPAANTTEAIAQDGDWSDIAVGAGTDVYDNTVGMVVSLGEAAYEGSQIQARREFDKVRSGQSYGFMDTKGQF